MNKYCERCGSKLQNGYCPVCGGKEKGRYSDFKNTHSQSERNISSKNIFWIFLLIMIIATSFTISIMFDIPYTDSIQTISRSQRTNDGLTISSRTYKNVEYSLPKEGEKVDYTLSAGNYVIGEDIAEGTYQIENLIGFGHFGVSDYENDVYINESLTIKEDNDDYFTHKANNVRLYKGAVLNIDSNSMKLSSINANTTDINEMKKNPLTSAFTLSHTIMVGEANGVSEGFYDIRIIEGEGEVDSGYDDFSIYAEFSLDNTNEYAISSFKNVYLKEYDRLFIDEGITLELTPSEYIRTRSER